MGIMTAFGTDDRKTKIVYIRMEPELERDYQRLRNIYPGNRAELMRFALQKFVDRHRTQLDALPPQS